MKITLMCNEEKLTLPLNSETEARPMVGDNMLINGSKYVVKEVSWALETNTKTLRLFVFIKRKNNWDNL